MRSLLPTSVRAACLLASAPLLGALLVAAPAEAHPVQVSGWGLQHLINRMETVDCTDGFHARDRKGRPIVLTAATCGKKGTLWYTSNNGRTLGRIVARRLTTSLYRDYAAIRVTGPVTLTPRVHDGDKRRLVSGVSRPRLGLRVCLTGQAKHRECGRITSITATSFTTTISAERGDVGGPIFDRRPNGTVRAVGILSSGDALGSTASRVDKALEALDLRLMGS
ncbi:MAG: S1 family peptidase [Nocardioides sp.]|uniref:S1 family peptidase n=1 Tax=Nocardioides sp. TaxID=35761 RepID=UPI0039E4E1E1